MVDSIIVGADGKPISKNTPALKTTQSRDNAQVGQLLREFALHPSRGLTPHRLYQIIEAAEQGDLLAQSDLFDDMEEKDPQIGADMAKRRQMAASLEWQIVAPDNASKQEKIAADFCAEVFDGLEVEDLILELGSGIGHGFANLELPWQRDGEHRFIEQPILRPQRWFRLHPDNQNQLMLRDNSATGAELWPLGWIQHRHKARPGYVARSGLHRQLVWPYLFQSYALGDLAELLEIYGLPARIGTYPANATDKQKATLLNAVTSLGHRAAGIIPEGMAIDFKEAADGKGDLFQTMLNWCEQAKAKVILGSTLTSGTGEGTNTNALGNVHERGTNTIIAADARQYAGTINRDLLWPLVALNFGIHNKRRAPRFYLETKEIEDYQKLATTLPTFVDMGAKIPLWWLHEKTGIPEASDDEAVLQPRPVATSPYAMGAFKTAALKAQNAQPTPLAPEQILAGTRDKAATHTDAWFAQIEALVNKAQSYEELQDKLLELYPALTLDEYAQTLSETQQVARLAGRNDIAEEH